MQKTMISFLALFLLVTSCTSVPHQSEVSKAVKKQVIILLGAPGSGKGTHGIPLSQKLSIPVLSTGDLLRDQLRNKTDLGEKARPFMEKGALVPDELIVDIVLNRISADDCSNGYILDGFPRTLPQAQLLVEKIKNDSQIKAIFFEVKDQTVIERITGRLSCPKCGRPYHKTFNPPKHKGHCDCGTELTQRADDKEEIIVKRLKEYHLSTEPVIKYFAEQNFLKTLDAEKKPDEVWTDLQQVL